LKPTAPINWHAAWLHPLRDVGVRVESDWRTHGLPAALNLHALHAVAHRFSPQADLPPAHAYEAHIFQTHRIPTRENLHDFFNGLAWLHFPLTKARLNALQFEQINALGVGAARGRVRDAITVFDENAAFWCGPADIFAALRAHDWHAALVAPRRHWLEAAERGQPWLMLFGHALLEKLVTPYKAITAHVVDLSGLDAENLDQNCAAWLSAEHLAAKPFAHLPVLGVPGWWPDNAQADFYNDTSVFRPLRKTT
jgi:Protein of unknown function (DUF3025)